MPRTLRFALLSVALIVLTAREAPAQLPYTWAGNDTPTGNWSTASNWTPSGGPPNGIGAIASFGYAGSYTSTVTIDVPVTVGAIAFDRGEHAGYSSYALTLGSGGSLTLNNGASNSTITTGPLAYSSRVSADLTVGGNGVLELSAAPGIQNYDTLTLFGSITASGGTVAITGGQVIFAGTNGYFSDTRIDAGAILTARPGVGLSLNSNLVLNGGIAAISGGTYLGSLGVGPGQVRFAADGGFAGGEYGDLQVRLSGGTGTLVWGSTPYFLGDGASLLLGAQGGYGAVDFQNGLDLNGANRTIRADGYAVISGQISSTGTGGLVKTGTGTLSLTGTNSYAGPTTVKGGLLLAADGEGLPAASNLVLDGGVYGANLTTFTRFLGTGPGMVQWGAGGGGFAANNYSGLAVRLNNGTGTVAWDVGGFVPDGAPLMLGNSAANGAVDFQNGIDLRGADRTVWSEGYNYSTGSDRISGVISNSSATPAGLIKDGFGTLELTGANTYNGPTVIRNGTLRAIDGVGLPASSNLTLDGANGGNATYEVVGNATLSRSVGTGPGQIQWTTNGGWLSVVDGTLTVRLNGGGTLVWGANGFLPGAQNLRLMASSTGPTPSLLDFQSGIDLAGADRMIEATGSYAYQPQRDVVRIAGPISNSGAYPAGVTVTSYSPVVEFSGVNTYDGPTRIYNATLRANPGVGLPDASYLEMISGVLEVTGDHTFTRMLGTGPGQLGLSSGGFVARDGALNVRLNNGTGTLTWGTTPQFLLDGAGLTLGYSASPGFTGTALADFQNDLDLNGADRTINLYEENATPGSRARISGVVRNSAATPAGLYVSGSGGTTLELTAANTYDGPTYLKNSTLRAFDGVGLPAASNLVFQDGVFEAPGTATFQRNLGEAAGQAQWYAGNSGGFSAATGTLTVWLNGTSETLTWGATPGFLTIYGALIFGSPGARGTVEFQNGLDLNADIRGIELRQDPAASAVTARLTGVVSNGGLSVYGRGVLELTAANTYDRGTILYGVTLLANNASGSATGTGRVTVYASVDGAALPGVLGGTGRVDGPVDVYSSGRVRAGNLDGVGSLTLGNGLSIYPEAALAARISDGSRPSTSPGGSTIWTKSDPASNNFLNVVGGTFTFYDGARVVIDGTGTLFTPDQAYSYQVAQVAGQDLSSLNVTDQALFGTVGFAAGDFRLFGDAGGAVYLSFTPVPEPGAVLFVATAGVGLTGLGRRFRRAGIAGG